MFLRLEKIHIQHHCMVAADMGKEGNALSKPEKPPMPPFNTSDPTVHGDKKRPLDADVVEAISTYMDSLV